MRKSRVLSYFKKYLVLIAIFIAGVAVASVTIYFTPLHNINLTAPSMKEIDPVALNDILQKNPEKYLVVDVRPQALYDAGHVPGSINITIPNIYSNRPAFPRSDKTIVLVCGDGRSAAVAYGYLAHYGFQNLLHVTGGYNNWMSEDLPSEKSN